jgi:hypothetical protein
MLKKKKPRVLVRPAAFQIFFRTIFLRTNPRAYQPPLEGQQQQQQTSFIKYSIAHDYKKYRIFVNVLRALTRLRQNQE